MAPTSTTVARATRVQRWKRERSCVCVCVFGGCGDGGDDYNDDNDGDGEGDGGGDGGDNVEVVYRGDFFMKMAIVVIY